jgi:hypothetical protein
MKSSFFLICFEFNPGKQLTLSDDISMFVNWNRGFHHQHRMLTPLAARYFVQQAFAPKHFTEMVRAQAYTWMGLAHEHRRPADSIAQVFRWGRVH